MKRNKIIIPVLLFLYAAISCARIGTPTGGPKDVTPPKVVTSQPQNYSTNYSDKEISIEFNEFIQLKSVNQELVVSPPQKDKPVVVQKGKRLVIQLRSDLRDSTTYTLNFGNAITDYNEGNPLPGYEFVFSTGPVLDSLSIKGRVLKAFDLTPDKDGELVMLYKNLNDSAPHTMVPAYITKTDEKGYFSINNIPEGKYRLFALKDVNANMMYDLPNEQVAFADSVITIRADVLARIDSLVTREKEKMLDSLMADTARIDSSAIAGQTKEETTEPAMNLNDSLPTDSLMREAYNKYNLFARLHLFEADVARQYLTINTRDDAHKLQFTFNIPLYRDSLVISPLNFPDSSGWYIPEYSANMDTIDLFLTDTTLVKQDSLELSIGFLIKDSLQNMVMQLDTLDMVYVKPENKGGRGKLKEEEKPEKKQWLKPALNISRGKTFDLNQNIRIISPYPVADYDKTQISFFKMEDTLQVKQAFILSKDSSNTRTFFVSPGKPWEPDAKYIYEMLPGAFTDIYGMTNDTTSISFNTQKENAYGSIILNLTNVQSPLIVQLLEKDKIVREQYTKEDGKLTFGYLYPKTYRIKVIFDLNGNKKWDTGDYDKHRQPEKVSFYNDNGTSVRANWDVELPWTLPAPAY
ncbi:MAG TPA: Ig-like domain-containing domain [Bacteroidales bacterium]|nr:Ig-like domain-containing domain [Bacteroidales bacterium]